MRPMPRCAAGLAWCATAAALLTAVAEEPEVVVIDGGAGAVQVQVQLVPAAPAGDAEPGDRKLDQLPPAPQLLEKVMQGLLEGMPGKETLDDVMRRAAVRKRAVVQAAEAAQRQQFIRQQTQQFEQMLQPLLYAELALVRRTCENLPPAVRSDVLTTSRQAVKDVAEQVARRQFEGGDEQGFIEVRDAIHDRVVAAVRPHAAADEFGAYERESQRRQERRAEAARYRIVSKLDEHLGLTAAQRSAVLEDLRSRWKAGWVRELEDHDGVLINDHPPAPDFADASIAPHLDPVQLRQWRQWSAAAGWDAIPRNSIDWSELNAIQQGQVKLDSWWRP